MQLDSLTLKNFKNHHDRTFLFTSGVNGITGKNGAGKSSIIEALSFLFTGYLEKTKEETITTGMVEGYVKGEFTHNGKKGTIERHLSSSRVVLKYDGMVKNKSSEVKTLWSTLLQIDEAIFNNVIIAKQGEIPALFLGNDTVREKIFQKIFLVPNTEKLRHTIWEGYIKTCPPPYPVEDVAIITSNAAELAKTLNPIKQKIDDFLSRTLNEATMSSVISRIAFLNKCKQDQDKRPVIEKEIELLTVVLNDKLNLQKELTQSLVDIDISSYKVKLTELNVGKHFYERKLELEHIIEGEKDLAEEVGQYKKIANDIASENITSRINVDQLSREIARITKIINDFNTDRTLCICPTCNQDIADGPAFIKRLKDELKRLEDQYSTDTALEKTYDDIVSINNKAIRDLDSTLAIIAANRIELEKIKEYNYSPDEIALVEGVISKYEGIKDQLATLQNDIVKSQSDLIVNNINLQNLAIYDGKSTLDDELQIMQQVLQTNQSRKDEINKLKLEEARLQTELAMLYDRIKQSEDNAKKNLKRDQYIKKLNSLYDLLHVSEFPRKLIQSYSSDVQDYLLNNIQNFTIPYIPKIVDGFRIEMYNDEGLVIPTISGGQKIIVGICLRLALHSLFAQSFPMWVIDEGTTHLDDDNVKIYFNLIQQIRNNSAIKQVIIIDHHETLGNVVDNLIKV